MPRSLRTDLNLPIRFFSEDGLITGQCLNVSESGLFAQFDRRVTVWMSGELTTSIGERHLNIKVRVARVMNGREAGLTFLIDGEDDRLTVRSLLDFAAKNSRPRASSVAGDKDAPVIKQIDEAS